LNGCSGPGSPFQQEKLLILLLVQLVVLPQLLVVLVQLNGQSCSWGQVQLQWRQALSWPFTHPEPSVSSSCTLGICRGQLACCCSCFDHLGSWAGPFDACSHLPPQQLHLCTCSNGRRQLWLLLLLRRRRLLLLLLRRRRLLLLLLRRRRRLLLLLLPQRCVAAAHLCCRHHSWCCNSS
jgi:hypothetical protein